MSVETLMSAALSAPTAEESGRWVKYKEVFKLLTQEKGYKDVDAVRFIAHHEKISKRDQKLLLNTTKQWKRAKSWNK